MKEFLAIASLAIITAPVYANEGGWTSKESVSAMDDSVSASIFSEKNAEGNQLAAMCQEGVAKALLFTNGKPQQPDMVDVKYRLDKEKPIDTHGFIAETGNLVIERDVSREFLQSLVGHEKLLMRYEDAGFKTHDISISLNGYDAAFKKVKEACNW